MSSIALSIPATAATALYAGKTIQIQVTYTPADANSGTEITWTGGGDFMSIDSKGLVTITNPGNQFGTSTIMAKSANGKVAAQQIQFSKLALCDFTSGVEIGATRSADIKDRSMRLAVKSLYGDESATVPDADIRWASDNTAVATIAAGTVSYVATGVTNISATVGALAMRFALNVATLTVVGEWKLTAWSVSSTFKNDVYLELKADRTFTLYQNLQAAGYTKYTGTYTYDGATSTISGLYSDGKAWATSYKVEIPTISTLVWTASNNSADISTYTKTTIPDNVKSSTVAPAAARKGAAEERRFL